MSNRRTLPDPGQLANAIRTGDRVALGRAITFTESARPEHQALSRAVISELLSTPASRQTLRIAITGAPGAGKSTLIEAFGLYLIEQGHRVAVLAIDPSSQVSGGSILGDKTRMEQLSIHDSAFIRPSPSGDSLGGVARKTRESTLLVEAAGYDIVLVETVGVGQSETAAHSMTDLFLLLLLPGAGDELQGIKRGIVEMADLLFVNKADGERGALAQEARRHYANATHLLPSKPSGWAPRVLTGSAIEHQGISELWSGIQAYVQLTQSNGYFEQNRQQQAAYWLKEALQDGLYQLFYTHDAVRQSLNAVETEVLAGRMSPFAAAEQVLEVFRGSCL